MIYTVTFNPSLDYIVSVKDFQLGRTNRTCSEQLVAGGKGINVSIVLKNLGFESVALGFVAGFTGEEIAKQVTKMGIENGFIPVDGVSRINVKLTSVDGTEINGQGPKMDSAKVQELMEVIKKETDLPPLIVHYGLDGFELNDGNHRYEAYHRLGIKEYHVIVWMTEKEEYADFMEKYSKYMQ